MFVFVHNVWENSTTIAKILWNEVRVSVFHVVEPIGW